MIDSLLKPDEVKSLRSLLKGCGSVVLTCHVRPDGDAIGSTTGLAHLLCSLGIKAKVVTPDQAPRALAFLPGYRHIVPFTKYPDYGRQLVEEADLIIGCDFNQWSRLSDFAPVVEKAKAKKVIIDHHEHPDAECDLMISYPDMSSTCELVFRLIAAMRYYEDMDLDSATAICTGIITDTRNLTVNTKHTDLYYIMVELLKKGVNKQLILKETLDTKSEDAIKLVSYALYERLKIARKHRAAIVWLSRSDLAKFKYEKGDTEGLVNTALSIRGVIYAIFMREDEGEVRLSMRSIGNFPVNKICMEHFDGGGHIQAAGGRYLGSIAECLEKVEALLPEYDTYMEKAVEALSAEGYLLK